MRDTFLLSLQLMGQGMLGIFVVILIIFVVLLFLGKPKKKAEPKRETKTESSP